MLLQSILVIVWFIISKNNFSEEKNNRIFVHFDIKYLNSKNYYLFQHYVYGTSENEAEYFWKYP